MAQSIFDIFESKAIAAYWKDVNVNMGVPDLGTKFFPNAQRRGLDLAWIRGKNNLPVALQPSAFDAKPSLRDRIGVTEMSTEMPFFREAMRLGEKDRQDIETLLAKGEQFVQPTILRIYDDVKRLVDGALVQSERMRMSLLYSGKIEVAAAIDSGRTAAYSYNFDPSGVWNVNNNNTLTTTAKWSTANAATSKPVDDILEIKDIMAEKYGVMVTEMVMNTATLKGLLASDSIKKAINPLGAANIILTRTQSMDFVQNETGIKISIYDKMYKDEEGVDKKYFPDGYVSFVPGYVLGQTWYGTTPEQFNMEDGRAIGDVSTSVVNGGVAITTIREIVPHNIQTVISQIVVPSFERIDDVYVLKVF